MKMMSAQEKMIAASERNKKEKMEIKQRGSKWIISLVGNPNSVDFRQYDTKEEAEIVFKRYQK